MHPLALPPNPVRRFYRGGAAIAALRGAEPEGDRVPEDWVGSATEAFGEPGVGLARMRDGTLLADRMRAEPEGWFGAAHAQRWGPDPLLLVKLLDAGERLPVHAHPAGPFARERLGTSWGKTEAWIVIGGEGDLWAGWREDVTARQLRAWVDAQDADAMLAALHRVPARAGDALLVPAGVPHAIGQGLLIAELQEPSDASVLVEWEGHGVDGEQEATLGLGWDTALEAVELAARDPAGLAGPPPSGAAARLLPEAADPFFRADRLAPQGEPAGLEAGFCVLVVTDGEGVLRHGDGELRLRRGDGVAVPHGAGATEVAGDVTVLCCRPPAPDAPEPADR